MPKLSSLSIFLPCFNDGESLTRIIPEVIHLTPSLARSFEVVVIDNGSGEETKKILASLSSRLPEVKVFTYKEKLGYGGALQRGFEACQMDYVFYTDGDGQYDVKELNSLVEAMADEIDVVNGYKLNRADAFYRRWIGKIYHHFVNLMFNLHLRDVDCDFRLFRRKIFEKVKIQCYSGAVCVELMRKIRLARCAIVEVPVRHYPRQKGRSQFFRPRTLAKALVDLVGLWIWLVLLRSGNGYQTHTYRQRPSHQKSRL